MVDQYELVVVHRAGAAHADADAVVTAADVEAAADVLSVSGVVATGRRTTPTVPNVVTRSVRQPLINRLRIYTVNFQSKIADV